MTIDEILTKYDFRDIGIELTNDRFNCSLEDCIRQAIQEYAEHYAKKSLEIAAKCAMIEEHIPEEELYEYEETPFIISGGYIRNEHWCNVNKDSILNIKLPDHV